MMCLMLYFKGMRPVVLIGKLPIFSRLQTYNFLLELSVSSSSYTKWCKPLLKLSLSCSGQYFWPKAFTAPAKHTNQPVKQVSRFLRLPSLLSTAEPSQLQFLKAVLEAEVPGLWQPGSVWRAGTMQCREEEISSPARLSCSFTPRWSQLYLCLSSKKYKRLNNWVMFSKFSSS